MLLRQLIPVVMNQVELHISLHDDVFQVCAVVIQLTVENGEPLFEVEYEDL